MNYPPPQNLPPSSPNIILAIVSLGLGVVGLIGMIPTLLFTLCGIFPIAFGIGAAVVGFLAKSRAKNDPAHYGGGGLAIGGIVVGILSIIAPILWFLLAIVLWFGLAWLK